MRHFLFTNEISQSFRASQNIYKVGAKPSVEPLYKNTQLQTIAQRYKLNKRLDIDIMARIL